MAGAKDQQSTATAMSSSFGAAADTAMVYIYEGADVTSGTTTKIFNQMLSDGFAARG